jgi:hypothetical protein
MAKHRFEPLITEEFHESGRGTHPLLQRCGTGGIRHGRMDDHQRQNQAHDSGDNEAFTAFNVLVGIEIDLPASAVSALTINDAPARDLAQQHGAPGATDRE